MFSVNALQMGNKGSIFLREPNCNAEEETEECVH